MALGAEIIEKHFTLDINMEGPDHKASLNPTELTNMVTAIRNIEKALGNGIKNIQESEKEVRDVARKSIVAAKKIYKGETISEEHLAAKRPGIGIEPKYIDFFVGMKAKNDLDMDTIIKYTDFE